MAATDVTPNRRGTRSREVVLDAAEQLMAEHGYEAATVAALVKASGIPLSSIYHYFGSKNGVLLAVMERGAVRFFSSLRLPPERVGTPEEHLDECVRIVGDALAEHPDFLRLLIVLALQPPAGDEHDVHEVVGRVRDTARGGLAAQAAIAFDIRADSKQARELARVALAYFDGAFVAAHSSEGVHLGKLLARLPAIMIALHRSA
jgi:AcrR family transcriptional regulator